MKSMAIGPATEPCHRLLTRDEQTCLNDQNKIHSIMIFTSIIRTKFDSMERRIDLVWRLVRMIQRD